MLPARFEEKLVRVPESGCWIWTAALSNGYGIYFSGKGRSALAHRFSYEQVNGPAPQGLDLDHLCRVRCCVNPAHLEPVSRKENLRRGSQRHQWTVRKAESLTHCPSGHEYTKENTRIAHTATGKERRCRACERAACLRWYHKTKHARKRKRA